MRARALRSGLIVLIAGACLGCPGDPADAPPPSPPPAVPDGLCAPVEGDGEPVPLLEVLAPPPVGHDAPFSIEVTPGCREALEGSIDWEVVSALGRPAASVGVRVERRGFLVRGRTAAWSPPSEPSWGIVPVSARASGALTLRMRWTHPRRAAIEREVRVLAAARTTGVPSIPIGAGALLRGGPFRITERPPGARAVIEPAASGLERFVPDAAGRWVLEDEAGRTLALRTGEHAATPLDCGRSECHARETREVMPSAMTGALLPRVGEPCAIACHATGEPGLPDGGFAHVAMRAGWEPPPVPPSDPTTAMPRALRRLAGVGCTACHGPGAIPEATARWAILRADVCASCHDAPPRYGHVAAWSASAMSRSDAQVATRSGACARCHTTAGFLESIGARAATEVPAEAGALGIACAACHAPHSEARLGTALVRRIPTPAVLGTLPAAWRDATSSVCLPCHSPPDDGSPGSSSAAILLGRGGRGLDLGTEIVGGPTLAPHAELPCTTCHAGAPTPGAPLERGAGHAFAIDRARCAPCHDAAMIDAAFAGAPAFRAELQRELDYFGFGADDHASGPAREPSFREGWAARDIRLVLGDRGAWAHAPGYARAILAELFR